MHRHVLATLRVSLRRNVIMERHLKKKKPSLARRMARLCPDQTTHVRRQITQRCLLITRCNAGQSGDGSADYEPPSGALKKLELHPPLNGQNQLSLYGKFSHQHTKELCFSSQFSHCRLQSDQHRFNHQIFFFFFQ